MNNYHEFGIIEAEEFLMIISSKFIELLSAEDDNEIEAIVSKMSEQDAKSYLKIIISDINKMKKESIDNFLGGNNETNN